MKKVNWKKEKFPMIAVLLLFIACACGWFYLSRYPKLLTIYPDELRYYSIAHAIATGRGYTSLNSPADFQKILYSLVIAPAFLAKNEITRISLIALINAVTASLGVVPSYLIARRITGKSGWRLACAVLYCVLPDMTFTMTFMSEVLFLPLALWCIYLFLLLMEAKSQKSFQLAVLQGILLYLLYLTKEVALAFLLSWVGYVFLYLLHLQFSGAQNREQERRRLLMVTGIMGAVFFSLFLTVKLTIFSGLGNSYHQQSLDAVLKDTAVINFIYGVYYYVICILLACGIFPLMLPAVRFRSLSGRDKKMFTFLLLLILTSAVTVSYTITIRENYLETVPRVHLRYVCYLWIPLAALCLHQSEIREKRSNASHILKYGIATILVLVIFGLLFQGVDSGGAAYYFDHPALGFLQSFPMLKLWGWKGLVCALFMVGMLLYLTHLQIFRGYYFSLIMIMSLLSVWNTSRTNRQGYQVSGYEDYLDGGSLKTFVRAHPDETFLVVSGYIQDTVTRKSHTFLDEKNTFYVSFLQILEEQGQDGLEISETNFRHHILGTPYSIDSVDYVLIPANLLLSMDVDDQIALDAEDYFLYRIPDPKHLPYLFSVGDIGVHEVPMNELYFPGGIQARSNIAIKGESYLGFATVSKEIPLVFGQYHVELTYSYYGEETTEKIADIGVSNQGEDYGTVMPTLELNGERAVHKTIALDHFSAVDDYASIIIYALSRTEELEIEGVRIIKEK